MVRLRLIHSPMMDAGYVLKTTFQLAPPEDRGGEPGRCASLGLVEVSESLQDPRERPPTHAYYCVLGLFPKTGPSLRFVYTTHSLQDRTRKIAIASNRSAQTAETGMNKSCRCEFRRDCAHIFRNFISILLDFVRLHMRLAHGLQSGELVQLLWGNVASRGKNISGCEASVHVSNSTNDSSN